MVAHAPTLPQPTIKKIQRAVLRRAQDGELRLVLVRFDVLIGEVHNGDESDEFKHCGHAPVEIGEVPAKVYVRCAPYLRPLAPVQG